MITTSIDINDRLINGQYKKVYDFGFVSSSVTKVYLELDDENAGKKAMSKDLYAINHEVVPIQMVEGNVRISKS